MKIPPKIHVLKIFDNKSVMTGHAENNDFCFPETLNVLRGKVNSSNSKTRKDSEKNELLDAYAHSKRGHHLIVVGWFVFQ